MRDNNIPDNYFSCSFLNEYITNFGEGRVRKKHTVRFIFKNNANEEIILMTCEFLFVKGERQKERRKKERKKS